MYLRQYHTYLANSDHIMRSSIKVLLESLYLTWIGCRELKKKAEALISFMFKKAMLWLNSGQSSASKVAASYEPTLAAREPLSSMPSAALMVQSQGER